MCAKLSPESSMCYTAQFERSATVETFSEGHSETPAPSDTGISARGIAWDEGDMSHLQDRDRDTVA